MLLDDRTFGCGSDSPEITLVSPEVFARKVAIAVEAASNTDCMVLARSYAADQADAIARCKAAQAAGAQMVGAVCCLLYTSSGWPPVVLEGSRARWLQLGLKYVVA